MIGVVLEPRVVIRKVLCRLFLAAQSGHVLLPEGGFCIHLRARARQHAGTLRDGHVTGGKVDLQAARVMDAAQVAHEHAVDVHPHVVVTAELKHHVVAVGLAVVRLHERRSHRQAEVVVECIVVTVIHVVCLERALPVDAKHGFGSVEREKLTRFISRRITVAFHTSGVVHLERVAGRIVGGVVLVAVVDVVAVLIQLEQAAHIFIDHLARLRAVGIVRVVKQVAQRLGAFGQDGVPVGAESILHDFLIWPLFFAGPLIKAITLAVVELEGMATVDAGPSINDILRIIVRAVRRPVIEQVDRRVRRRNRLDEVGIIRVTVCLRRLHTTRDGRRRDDKRHEQHHPQVSHP